MKMCIVCKKELEVGFEFDWLTKNKHYYIIETNCNHVIAEVLNNEIQR